MFKNLKVGARLALGFAAVLVLMAIISAISLSRLGAIKADLEAVTGEAPERLANNMRDLARAQGMGLRDAVMQDDVAFKKKEFDLMKKARADYDQTAQTLAGMPIEPEVKAALEKAASAQAAVSSGSMSMPASPTTSGMAAARDAITGVPLAIASSSGSPNPSYSDG